MEPNSPPPIFPATELDGGYVVAIEAGHRREMVDQMRHLDDNTTSPGESAGAEQDEKPAETRTERKDAAITVGAQMGDKRASNAVAPHFMALKQSFDQFCAGPYSSEVAEFALVLRVDGDIWHWNRGGCDRMRRSKKDRYITIDIYVPKERWDGASSIEIRRYLAATAEEALQKMLDKLRRDKAPVKEAAILTDFAEAKQHYLAQVETT